MKEEWILNDLALRNTLFFSFLISSFYSFILRFGIFYILIYILGLYLFDILNVTKKGIVSKEYIWRTLYALCPFVSGAAYNVFIRL